VVPHFYEYCNIVANFCPSVIGIPIDPPIKRGYVYRLQTLNVDLVPLSLKDPQLAATCAAVTPLSLEDLDDSLCLATFIAG
jgi:hypothetical protein